MLLPDKDIMCPATAFSRSCRSIVTECTCPKLIKVRGSDPQTGAAVDHVGCSDSILPMLLLEVSKHQRETGAAIESFRNEVRRQHDVSVAAHQYISNIVPRPTLIDAVRDDGHKN